MTDSERDFFSASSFSPSLAAQSKPAPTPSQTPPQAHSPAAPFENDSPLSPDKYTLPQGQAALLARLADLARSPTAPTPFALALIAPEGGGKTSALGWLATRLGANGGPPVVRFEAAQLAAEPERALAAGLYSALAPTQGALVARAARDAEDFGSDAGTLARGAQSRLDDLRQKLISERQALDEQQARRAALPETMLYDWPGSQVDSFARRMRSAFESRMRGFGLTGDALLTFKDRTRDLAAHESLPGRLLASLRSVWAYRGQTKLLVWAVILYILSQGADWLALHKPDWLSWIAHLHEAGAQTADFLRDRISFLDTASTLLFLLALACLGLNFWRAYSFSAPLLRASRLLDKDVTTRTSEMDRAVAHQQLSVDRLADEAAAAAENAGKAKLRAENAGASNNPPAFLEREPGAHRRDQALGFLHKLSAALKEKNARLIVAIDGFEAMGVGAPVGGAVSNGESGAGVLFERLGALLAQPGFVAVFALDAALCSGKSHARLLQLPLRLDAAAIDPPAFAPVEAPLSPVEERLLAALAPLAGNTPRAKKRLRNYFSFLRPAQGEIDLGPALAFCLAMNLGGDKAEREALHAVLNGKQIQEAGAPRLVEYLAIAQEIGGQISGMAALRRAAALAETLAR